MCSSAIPGDSSVRFRVDVDQGEPGARGRAPAFQCLPLQRDDSGNRSHHLREGCLTYGEKNSNYRHPEGPLASRPSWTTSS